jgi:hypothetical protein
MDSVVLVTTALAAGAASGSEDAASSAVRDAYTGLRVLVRSCLAGRHAGEMVLTEFEHNPDLWAFPLRAELLDAWAGHETDLVAAAQELMALLDAGGSRVGKYVVTVHGAQGVQVGDHNTQHNTFGPGDP